MATVYQILRMETLGTPPLIKNGEPLLFDDPAEAAKWAKYYSNAANEKMCVKPLINDEWRLRENARYATGKYRFVSWSAESWWMSDMAFAIHRDHYPHASLEKPGFVAYTASPEDGMKDKQSLLRPGAYLNKYFKQAMAVHGITEKRLIDKFNAMYGEFEIKFAKTEKEIEEVYAQIHTCLYGKRWPKNIHPATMYAAGDLEIAYIGDIDKCNVSARALVWPQKKLHSRVYGDIARLTIGLERLGYKWGPPIGAKLKRVVLHKLDMNHGKVPTGCFLVPYIDKKNQAGGGHLSVKDDGQNLIICEEALPGSHHASQPDGFSGIYVPREDEYPTFTCERCDRKDREQLLAVYDGAPDPDDDEDEDNHPEPLMWCHQCTADASVVCHYSGKYYTQDVEMVTVDGHTWARYYAKMYAAKCDGNGELFSHDTLKWIYFPDGSRKFLSHKYIKTVGTVFTSALTNRWYFTKGNRMKFYAQYGREYDCAKFEAKHHLFLCDGCDSYNMNQYRFQTHGDDRLYCEACHIKQGGKEEKPPKSGYTINTGTSTSGLNYADYQHQVAVAAAQQQQVMVNANPYYVHQPDQGWVQVDPNQVNWVPMPPPIGNRR